MASASQRGLGLLPRELLRIECFRSRPHRLVFVHQRVGQWIDPRTRLLRPLFQRLEPDRGVRRLAQLGEPLLPGLALRLLGGRWRVARRGCAALRRVRGDRAGMSAWEPGGRRGTRRPLGLRRRRWSSRWWEPTVAPPAGDCRRRRARRTAGGPGTARGANTSHADEVAMDAWPQTFQVTGWRWDRGWSCLSRQRPSVIRDGPIQQTKQ